MTESLIKHNVTSFTDDKFQKLLNTNNNTPRFNISFIQKLINDKLQLTPTSIRILFKLITYTDVTGEIHAGQGLSEIEATMIVRHDTFIQGLDRLIKYGFVLKKNGNYFLASDLFTTYQSELTNGRFLYFDNYAVLQDDAVMGDLTLNDMRLLLHLYANRSPQMYSRTRITNLYKNNFVKNSKGLDFFDSFQDLVKSFSKLTFLGLIDLKLSYSKKYCTLLQHQNKLTGQLVLMVTPDMTMADIESIILSYYERDSRKKLGNTTSTYFLIDYRMPNTHYTNKIQNKANYSELRLLCDAYGISFDEISDSEQIGYVIGNKNMLYKLAGDFGCSLYKQALNDLFNEHKERVSTFVALERFANVLVDYYILPAIEEIILNFNNSFVDNEKFDNLCSYYQHKVSEERLMVFILENEAIIKVLLQDPNNSLKNIYDYSTYLWKKSYSNDMQQADKKNIIVFEEYKRLVKEVFANQIRYDSNLVQVYLDNNYLLKLKMQETNALEEKVKQFNFAAQALKNTYKKIILEQELSSLGESYTKYAHSLVDLLHDKIFVHSDETPMSVEEIYELTDDETRKLFSTRRTKIRIWANEYLHKFINTPTPNTKVPFYNWLEERD
ncbi:hypothetical protein PVA17_24400 [Lysinibacillus sp. CNPSo 3705]|uniref:hypothetical protein n=1 Tax=Lysinibacillus sp. CNPSo 3705 TaxID=3028148 RepID=UPI0023634047|nr:hypothetical protein [Lysinibacillus sp. CNPSo 3705]MDD1505859.1 hypothetical protein [Lysinibacillus sp. CNPSo 3705]